MNLKKEIGRFFVYGLGTISGSVLNFLLMPLYLVAFSPAEYGVVNILWMVVTFSSLFVSAGMMSAVQRQYFAVEGEDRRIVVGTAIVWYLAALTVVSIPLVGFRTQLSTVLFDTDAYARSVGMVTPLVLLTLLLDVPLNVLRLEKRAPAFVVVSLTRLLVDAAFKYILIVRLQFGVEGYLLSTILALIVSNILAYPLVWRSVSLRFRRKTYVDLLRISAPYILTGFAIWSLQSVDRLMLNFLSSSGAAGIYSVGVRFGQIYNILFYQPVSLLLPAVVFPTLSAAAGDHEAIERFFRRIMNGLVFLGTVVGSVIAIGSIGLVELFSTIGNIDPAYLGARPIIPLLVASNMLYSFMIPAGYSALHISKTRVLAIGGIVAAIANVILNLVLIPILDVRGAALATLLSYVVYGAVSYTLVGKLVPVRYPLFRLALQLAAFAGVISVSYLVQVDNGFLIAVVAGISAVAVLGIVASVAKTVDPEIGAAIRRIARRLVGRRTQESG